jgi:hypothetical protein
METVVKVAQLTPAPHILHTQQKFVKMIGKCCILTQHDAKLCVIFGFQNFRKNSQIWASISTKKT